MLLRSHLHEIDHWISGPMVGLRLPQ